ncbi:unnamed protein product [Blepharisma stoltei]|uniref:MORN repeat protein n=1 Tax=Blepharisma stoltei TaxID=1481888 RepID=A0AAU9IUJ9_9CILI|nr:unnamed protein product [Blepharisma stoltei]
MFEGDKLFPVWGKHFPSIIEKEFTVNEIKEMRKKIKETPYKELFEKNRQFFNPYATSKYLELPPLKAVKLEEDGLKDKVNFKGKDGNVYTGQVDERNRRNGLGYLLYVDGSLHMGFFYAGATKGRGRRIDTNGIVYQGNFKDGVLKGEGSVTWPNGFSYDGSIEDGIPHGTGTETTEDYTYTGNFVRGEKHGYGEINWKDGSWYKGHFTIQKIEGEGVYHWTNGNEYEGEWFRNKMHGKGIFKWADGKVYGGDFSHGQREGHGKLTWPSGRQYEGYWEKGLYDGIGIEILEDGTAIEGVWVSGTIFKKFDPVVPGPDEDLFDHIGSREVLKQLAPNYDELLKKVKIVRRIGKIPKSEPVSDSFKEPETDYSREAKKERREILVKDINDKKSQMRNKRLKEKNINTDDPRKAILLDLESPLSKHQVFLKAYTIHATLPPFNYEDPDFEMPFDLNFYEEWTDVGEGKLYKGQVDDNDKAQGMGTLLYKGRIYEGFWKNNKKHGLGRQIGAKGDVYQGYWLDGKRNGFGVYEIVDKNYLYIGDWEDDVFHGRGILTTAEAAYEGEWKENKQHGIGALVYDDGRVYNGEFKQGIIQGYGSLIWPNGKGYAGQWKNGEMIGVGTQVTKEIKSLYEQGLADYISKRAFKDSDIKSFIPESEIPEEGTFGVVRSKISENPQELQESYIPDEPGAID